MHKGLLFVAAVFGSLAAFTTDASARERGRSQEVTRPTPVEFRQTVAAADEFLFVSTGPTDDEVARGVVKAIGALVSHELSKPKPNDKPIDTIGRAIARATRDKLIDSALEDLVPNSPAVERAAVRNLVILAFDGQLTRDRDRVVAHLRKTNPDMADVVEVAEFLIQVGQAADKARR